MLGSHETAEKILSWRRPSFIPSPLDSASLLDEYCRPSKKSPRSNLKRTRSFLIEPLKKLCGSLHEKLFILDIELTLQTK